MRGDRGDLRWEFGGQYITGRVNFACEELEVLHYQAFCGFYFLLSFLSEGFISSYTGWWGDWIGSGGGVGMGEMMLTSAYRSATDNMVWNGVGVLLERMGIGGTI